MKPMIKLMILIQAILAFAAPAQEKPCTIKGHIITKTFFLGPFQNTVSLHNTDITIPSGLTINIGFTNAITGNANFQPPSTSTITPKVSVSTSGITSGTVQILPTPTQKPDTTGSVVTSLQVSGLPTSNPIISNTLATPTSTISTANAASKVAPLMAPTPVASSNVFQPVAADAPPAVIGVRSDHPVPRLNIQSQSIPKNTNKFYANFFLGSQADATWTHPYSVAWAKGAKSWGLAISHIDANQRVYGPNAAANPVEYFINPIGIQSIILSANELGNSTTLTTDTLTDSSINVNLLPSPGAVPAITFPLVQGVAFVTGIFNGATPKLESGVYFQTLTRVTPSPKSAVTKYRILLADGKTWVLYAYSTYGAQLVLQVVNNALIQATSNWNGIIQIAKAPNAAAEAAYDAAAGAYATSSTISGSVSGAVGTYQFTFAKQGLPSATLLMFALPHHVASFSSATKACLSSVQLQTTTKGVATAVSADSWTLVESNMPTSMQFLPGAPGYNFTSSMSYTTQTTIRNIALNEISQDINAQTNLDSMYFSGKALAKFAGILLVLNDILSAKSAAQAGLSKLKTAFAVFTSNTQKYPLVRETAWGGIVSSGSYTTGDPNIDFGNTFYNDHHFHYGYFIYTAAVIAHLDPSWLTQGQNKAWVNALVRDTANPSTQDPYFPVHRAFDWYHGHSWAHGLYASADGKDEESSSEDTMFAYALYLWGIASGDANLRGRSLLQLTVLARSLQSYFLYTDANSIIPSNFRRNRVSGILFENKIDHTTYFGTNIEFIQGIHMLPLLPSSALTRTAEFVSEEWNQFFSGGRADAVQGGWRGILYANLALIDARTSWNFFAQSGFQAAWLDGGASRSWYLAWAAALGGAPS